VTNAAGVTVSVDVSADKSAKGIASAINASGAGVKASLVKVSETESVMQLNGTKTGVANSFTVAGLDNASSDLNGLVQTVDASDATIVVGDLGHGGYSIDSSTNTFTGLMAGVTMTVSKLEDGITLSSDSDVSGIAAKFKALVDAANASLTEVSNQTAYDSSTKVASPLTGDFMVRQLSQSILGAVSGGQAGIGSLSKIGIQLDKTGKLSFESSKFTAAYEADPDSIKAAGIALGDTFEALAGKQSSNVKTAITSRNSVIDSMNLQIGNWDVRLVAKQASLQKTYTGLETALGKLKNQSTWLSGQISSLS
jgi:flagellar hook-associated protein 2